MTQEKETMNEMRSNEARRPYSTPTLREYGAIRELTAGGTWKAKEREKGKGKNRP